jgi:hypothetical protein
MNANLTLSQAVEGYLIDARARQLSSRTTGGYTPGRLSNPTALPRDRIPAWRNSVERKLERYVASCSILPPARTACWLAEHSLLRPRSRLLGLPSAYW